VECFGGDAGPSRYHPGVGATELQIADVGRSRCSRSPTTGSGPPGERLRIIGRVGAHVCQRIDIANRRVSVIRSPVALVRLKVDRPYCVGPKMSEEAKVDDTPRCPIGGQSEASSRPGLLEKPRGTFRETWALVREYRDFVRDRRKVSPKTRHAPTD
jgi:hypothetical protein